MDNPAQQKERKDYPSQGAPEHGGGIEAEQPGLRIEREPRIERRPEQENTLDLRGRETAEQPRAQPPPTTLPPAPPTSVDPLAEQVKQVETILEENLQAVFKTMSPAQQLEFKREGETTARKVVTLLSAVKLKVKEITSLLLRWLRFIPGVSQFFVEQEAKIKTDKLLELRRRQSSNNGPSA